jgi:membrane protein
LYAGLKKRLRTTSPWILLKTTVEEWNVDNASRLAAALAYYIIFSMAPLLVIGVAITGMVLGQEAAQGTLVGQIARYVNSQEVAELIQTMIQNAGAPSTNFFATIVGIVVLFYAASCVFGELKDALNLIWDVPPKPTGGLIRLLVNRLLMLVMVIVSGFLLLASLVADTGMAAATIWLNIWWPGIATWGQAASFVFFFIVTLGVFALIYKYVPDIRIAWRDVWIGAVATTLLFSIGRLLIGWYLGRSTVASTYGAAGSLGALLLWIYFSTQLFFLGAEFTQVYGRTYGSRWREHVLLADPAPETGPQVGEAMELQPEEGVVGARVMVPGRVEEQQRRSFTRPLTTLAIATGVIAAISIFNLIRAPFRR